MFLLSPFYDNVDHKSGISMAALTKLTPPKDLTEKDRDTVFQHFFCRLASHRNSAELYANAEYGLSHLEEAKKLKLRDVFVSEINSWAKTLLEKAWIVCQEPGGAYTRISISVL